MKIQAFLVLEIQSWQSLLFFVKNKIVSSMVWNYLENFKKKIPESRITNSYWLDQLMTYERYKEDNDKLYEEAISEINAENIKAVLQALLAQGNFIEVIMSPEN